jgi:radical SAM superfamily enzyme YgiQ (UPF0313 family)
MNTAMNTSVVTLCSATLSEDGMREPPLGPLYIASALEELGINVDFRDLQLDETAHGFSAEPLVRCLGDHADIVAISCFVDMLPVVVEATRELHAARPDTLFLLGGPGPTACARRILEQYPWVSAVAQGEGEETVHDWIQLLRGQHHGPIAGMVYRDLHGLVEGPARPRIRALDDLPPPAYHLLDWQRYTHARIITTRGCSYRCSFCDVTALWGNHSVYRSIDATIAELEGLRERVGARLISIVDDTFVLNRRRVGEFCQALIERDVDIEWGCFGRINLMTPELIELMARAGCRAIFYGIDSGSQAVLDRTVKRVKVEQIMPVLKTSAQHFKKVEASFIWGYPFETLDDFMQTVDLAGEASRLAPIVNVQLHMLSPLPMSPLYRNFPDDLHEPEVEDRPWLLLPAVLLDRRAARIREIVRDAPDIYPGFYTYPSPAKAEKRAVLLQAMRALERTIGKSLVDSDVKSLTTREDTEIQAALLAAESDPIERIGVGLALGFLRRTRNRQDFERGLAPFEGTRGPHLVRQRGEPVRSG